MVWVTANEGAGEMMKLDHLLRTIDTSRIDGPVDVEVTSIECDSRRVQHGSMFVAIRGGEEEDRQHFVGDAIRKGASAVVVEEGTPEVDGVSAITRITVPSCRKSLAELAARFNEYPARDLLTVGVTGTNGKTTTALIVREILEAAGQSCGYLGTLGKFVSGDFEEMPNTTPEASQLHSVLGDMVTAGKRAAVMEVSSHSLVLGRVEGIEFDAAVFTNLTRDHLDFHGTEEAYFEAKAALFEQVSDAVDRRPVVVNVDDGAGLVLASRYHANSITFGRAEDADVAVLGAASVDTGTDIVLRTPLGQIEVHSRLTGAFNVSNVMAAVACGIGLGVDAAAITAGVQSLEGVPGRFEQINCGQPFRVIVDYAHTPAGLETVLQTARALTGQRLICVFGCGGDRDVGKRPLMGGIAADLADVVVLTSDNPRSESPDGIISDIAAGTSGATEMYIDREEAIRAALESAAAGDVVVIAGKGSEDYQIFADRTISFDDRQVARQALGSMGWA